MDVGQPPDYLKGMVMYLNSQLEKNPEAVTPEPKDGTTYVGPVLVVRGGGACHWEGGLLAAAKRVNTSTRCLFGTDLVSCTCLTAIFVGSTPPQRLARTARLAPTSSSAPTSSLATVRAGML